MNKKSVNDAGVFLKGNGRKKLLSLAAVGLTVILLAGSLSACGFPGSEHASSDSAVEEISEDYSNSKGESGLNAISGNEEAASEDMASEVFADGSEGGDMSSEELAAAAETETQSKANTETGSDSKNKKESENKDKEKSEASDYTQKLIYTYYYEYETTDYDKSMSFIQKAVDKYHGYVESSSEYGTSSHYSNMTLRIPKEEVEAFLKEAGSIGTVTSKEVNTEDITLRYYDLKAHMETLNTQRDRLMELLDKAKSVSDITEIQSQLSQVEYEINSYGTQLKVYDNQVDYVTINISLNEVQMINPSQEDSFLTRVKKGLSGNTADLLNGLVEFAIWFITMIPYFILLLVIGCIAGLGFRLLKKKGVKLPGRKKGHKKNEKKNE